MTRRDSRQNALPVPRAGNARAVVIALLVGLSGAARVDASAQSLERQMYVSVLDADGAPVAELTVEDFTVREDGLLREVLRVSPATEPMQVALLVDNSVAMSPYLRDLRNGLESFVEQLAGDHEVAVITFGDRPTIVVDYTRSLIELRQAIGRIFPRPGSGALLLDAIYNAGQGLQRRQAARPVFVVVTTEGVEYSNRPYRMVLRTIEDAGATFHAVVMTASGSSFDTGSYFRDLVLDRGTARTGGRRIDLLRGQRIEQTLEAIGRELVSQYLLVYARPEMLVPPERIELGTTRDSLTARGRPVREAP